MQTKLEKQKNMKMCLKHVTVEKVVIQMDFRLSRCLKFTRSFNAHSDETQNCIKLLEF